VPLQFDKLRVSAKQKDFWSERFTNFAHCEALVKHISKHPSLAYEDFWTQKGIAELQRLNPQLWDAVGPQDLRKYCDVWQSKENAWLRLILKARGEAEARSGKPAGFSFGKLRLDERKYALQIASTSRRVSGRILPSLIHRAAQANDVRFFIRLGKVLQSSKHRLEVDWTRVDTILLLLVQNWCEGNDYHSALPPLCFFSDQALADFCSTALGREPGNPSSGAIRQWRLRLGLKQYPQRIIRETIVTGSDILLK
jgi:hypothetical protein